ncbi:zinc protease [Marchantia polymorpha subsp. ruderalis]|uniref:Peptidase M16 N-terminal domain-containing protein n=2 Tax=Marchantia polymorpha TaxID=3197 RepID=A0AAF6AW87_MARPO|nr:hypothetical protein MARPO_0007s0115 [Marchantia polymorpha]BBN04021.1 hypothetical protein Mp_3g01210 [Marchantia polymorpha subsp. ruderalis]|eukprot:PTQ47708.1 hypothetical protein MARPO_0007s0115 [Marchantia polymorpha]
MDSPLPIGAGSGGFKALKLLTVKPTDPFPEGVTGVQHGVLENGLHYYVRRNPKPRLRAALALGVRVGSVLEEEEERGVAHILEHLAFSATKQYTNHDIVRFLESVGAEFGACQNASTSPDETIYDLFVPIDKPELLSQAISILAEFSTEIRASEEDLEKERGAVLEELRIGRNALGRMQEAHWLLMMKGSQYADRQPIGLESVVRNVSAKTVQEFYQRWYRLNHMAIVAVGDFPDTDAVVNLIKTHFGHKRSPVTEGPPREIPLLPVPPHEEPRFSCFAEAEAGGSAVTISCKIPASDVSTIADYRYMLAEGMFHNALTQRFFKISRNQDPPFFSCSSISESFVRPVKAYIMSANCKEKGTLQALESMLVEVARIRLHGFSEREIALERAYLMADIESAYLEKDQMPSTNLRDEYLQHFLRGEPILGIDYKAQLQKTLLPEITAAEVTKIAECYLSKNSCVVKTVEPRARVTQEDLKAVLYKVEALESRRDIPPWDEELIPDDIVEKIPAAGSIVTSTEFPEFSATELILSNGMRVCYKCTDFLDDQVLIHGYTYGGLSEVLERDFLSCSMGSLIAGEIGVFGHKPSTLTDMLAGKRAEVGTKVGAYKRTFFGDCSPSDLEIALQLLYQLFVTTVQPGEEEVKLVMQMTREEIKAQERDPFTAYANRVRELNYGNSYYFKPVTARDLNKVNPKKACEYFDNSFRDPSSFTVAIVGNIEPAKAVPLILRFLGGIPKPEKPIMEFQRDELKALPFTFPDGVIREEVRRHMVEAQCSVQMTFPVEFKGPCVMVEVHFTGFICKLLETKIMQVLRFKHGQVYSVSVSAFLGGSRPSRTGNVRGDVAINFSCDPDSAWKLVDLALDEVSRLQEEGPTQEDVATVLELEQRTYENGQQENGYWLDRLLRAYQSRVYTGDLQASFQAQEEWRSSVRSTLTPDTMKDALCRILPVPCRSHHTAVALMPKADRMTQLRELFSRPEKRLKMESKMLLATAGVLVLAAVVWRYSQRSS